MRKEYQEELENLTAKMEAAEKFAEKLTVFEEVILRNKLTGSEVYTSFGERYKDLPLTWGIKRGLFKSGTPRHVINYPGGEYEEYLFNIYINSISLFDFHFTKGLKEIVDAVPLFFYDTLNSTFYATDEQITSLLEELNKWYLSASKEVSVLKENKKIDEAKQQIASSEQKLSALSNSNH